MNREQAINYLKSSGMSEEQIKDIISALTCEDCISREQMMNLLDKVGGDFDKPREAVVPLDYVADMVADLPSVIPKEKVGHWITCGDVYMCSECDSVGVDYDNYCPNCGAKMTEIEEEE